MIGKSPIAPNKGKLKGLVTRSINESITDHIIFEVLVQETSDVEGMMFNPLQNLVGQHIEVLVSTRLPWSILVEKDTIEGYVSLKGDEQGTKYYFVES